MHTCCAWQVLQHSLQVWHGLHVLDQSLASSCRLKDMEFAVFKKLLSVGSTSAEDAAAPDTNLPTDGAGPSAAAAAPASNLPTDGAGPSADAAALASNLPADGAGPSADVADCSVPRVSAQHRRLRQLGNHSSQRDPCPGASISDDLPERATRLQTTDAAQPPFQTGATSMQRSLMLAKLNLATRTASTVADHNSLFGAFSQQQQRLNKGDPWFQNNHLEAQAQHPDVRQATAKALADSEMVGFLISQSAQIRGLAKERRIVDPFTIKTRMRSNMGTSLGYLVTKLVEPPQAVGALLPHCLRLLLSISHHMPASQST